MIIYNVFWIPWTYAYQSNVFYHGHDSMLVLNSIQLLGSGQLPVSSTSGFGEGNGTPLQYSCLENPMDGGAWWAAVHGVMKSWT